VAIAAVLAIVFGAAPTVGDVGGCGTTASDLDPGLFARLRKQIDCQRCGMCGLATRTCKAACDPGVPPTAAWPATCHPLAQDGDVCVRALRAASCSDYAAFVDDVAPTNPTECDFCRLTAAAEPAPAARTEESR
jgi:hypothetical protein